MSNSMNRIVKPLLFLMAVIAISSCATMFSGKTQNVRVSSYPDGARVFVDGKDQGVITPAEVKIRRKRKVELAFQKEGYPVGRIEEKGKFNPTTCVNLLGFLVPGTLIDWGTGSIYKYSKSIHYNFGQPVAEQKDPTITKGESSKAVSRDNPGGTDLERTVIRWFFDSEPRGARLFWRVISSVPAEVKNTNESYLGTTPYEETRSFNILGLTYENSRDVTIEIKLTRPGYMEQVKRFNVRQAIDQQEISSFFDLVAK